jgi:hypothetical protein
VYTAAVNASQRSTVIWLGVALGVFGVAFLSSRLNRREERPSWQRAVSELTRPQQRFHADLREQLRAAERERGKNKTWPAPGGIFPNGWVLRQQGSYVNYLGEGEGLRWLVLFIEPDGRTPPENVPEDEEHHTLSDGTALHVTVWTQPLSEAPAGGVTGFPAAEGWVERVTR